LVISPIPLLDDTEDAIDNWKVLEILRETVSGAAEPNSATRNSSNTHRAIFNHRINIINFFFCRTSTVPVDS
jgi:hypothetical protein